MPRPSLRTTRSTLWFWIYPMVWGMVLGILPNLAQRLAHGTWLFLGTDDDFYYGMIARTPFFHGWSLRDPFANALETLQAPYAWALFVPMAKLAALFGNNSGAFLLGWRALGGALLGGGLWFFLHTLFERCGAPLKRLAGVYGTGGLAALIAAIVIADPGFDYASFPLERAAATASKLLHHVAPEQTGRYLQFRIVSPLCALGAVLALLGVLCAPKLERRAALVGGLLLGVLFNLYFFYWTAAVALISILLALQLLPRAAGRWLAVRHPPKLLLCILGLGLAFGLPQLFADLSSFGDPIVKQAIERTPRGIALAWQNPARWLYLTGPRLWIGCIVALVAAKRVRALRIPSLLVIVSFVLGNSAIATSLEFENYKWFHTFNTVGYVSMWCWALVEGARFLRHRQPSAYVLARRAIVIVLGSMAAIAVVWIPRESLTAPGAMDRTRWQADLAGLEDVVSRFDANASLITPTEAMPALLYARCGVLYVASNTFCSFISDQEFIERHVLSAWVLGEDRSALERGSYLRPRVFGESRPRWTHIREDYEKAVRETPAKALDKFHARYALMPCAKPPTPETGNWRPLGRNKRWCAWERSPTL